MKRLMQVMLAVALVLATAFTFYIDTASAQPVSTPVPADCSCTVGQTCTIPPGGSCFFANAGQVIELTLTNPNRHKVQAEILGGDLKKLETIEKGTKENPGVSSNIFVANSSAVIVNNLSRRRGSTIYGSFVNIVGDPGT
ncbi:MAG: hypothetical protein ACR9NN_01330 [Nostochopsis sp.]